MTGVQGRVRQCVCKQHDNVKKGDVQKAGILLIRRGIQSQPGEVLRRACADNESWICLHGAYHNKKIRALGTAVKGTIPSLAAGSRK